jgi:hypothetical protein
VVRRLPQQGLPNMISSRRYFKSVPLYILVRYSLVFILRLIATSAQEYITPFTLCSEDPTNHCQITHPVVTDDTYSSNSAIVPASSSESFVPRLEVMARRNRLWSSGDPAGSTRTVVGVNVRSLAHGDDFVGLWRITCRSIPAVTI